MIDKCHRCDEPAVWEVPHFYTKGSITAELRQTESRLECEYHGQESRSLSPYLKWQRIGGPTKL